MVCHALTFARSLRTWRMLMHWKTMFDRYYCIKTENICYISRYFLHYFVSPFPRCLANAISTDCARSKAGQHTSRNGSKSVPRYDHIEINSAWFASVWFALLIHGFSPVNARLLITCDTVFFFCNKIYVKTESAQSCYGAWGMLHYFIIPHEQGDINHPDCIVFVLICTFQGQLLWNSSLIKRLLTLHYEIVHIFSMQVKWLVCWREIKLYVRRPRILLSRLLENYLKAPLSLGVLRVRWLPSLLFLL